MLYKTYEFYSKQLLRANPHVLFVYGDNLMRQGCGGQAQVRYEPNALGLATKRAPGVLPEDFFSPTSCMDLEGLLYDLHAVVAKSVVYDVVIPFDRTTDRTSLGCGLSELPQRAPGLYSILALALPTDLLEIDLVAPPQIAAFAG